MWRHHRLYLHCSWSQYVSAVAKQSKFPSFLCFLWIVGDATSTKQALHSDELTVSGPQGMTDSFSHTFPHRIHLTCSLFMACSLLHVNTHPCRGEGVGKHQIFPCSPYLMPETGKDSICCVEALVGYYMVGVKAKYINKADRREMCLGGKKATEGKGIKKNG